MTDMIDMFKNCSNLVNAKIGSEYVFSIEDKKYIFNQTEIDKLKEACSNFTFENKDVPRLRKITNTFMKKIHPECLL